MLDLTGSYKYFLFNGSVDMRKGLFGLAETVRKEMQQNPIDSNSVYIFMSKSLSNDIVTMSNEMMKNAVNYTLNQWNNLRNYILNGQVQISNNLVEQRMKPIKLNLKVCRNIGSEPAAEDTAFIFSLTESCTLNNITPETYLEKLLRCIHEKDVDKKALLPCYYK